MASFRTALALISICILVSLSGLGDCRVPLQREQVVAGVEEKEQSVHLILPSEKEQFNEIAREIQPSNLPLEKPDLRGNDRIFHGERSRGFRFGRPGGCHHGKFNRRGHRNSDHMPFPVEFLDLQAESGNFHPRMDRPLPEKREFDPGFSKGEWMHPEGGKKGQENEHMPSPARGGWLEFLLHPFLRHDDPAEFHPRVDEFRPEFRPIVDEFRPEFGHGFPRADEFRPRVDEFRPEFGHGFPRADEFRPIVDEFKPEFGHVFPRVDEFHPGVDEFRPEFGHGFPNGGEGRQHRDETGDWKKQEESFPQALPVQLESEAFHSRVEELMPLPRQNFEHGFPGREGRQPGHGHGHGHGGDEKENEDMPFSTESVTYTSPVQAESTEFHSSVVELIPEEILSTDLQAQKGGEKKEISNENSMH